MFFFFLAFLLGLVLADSCSSNNGQFACSGNDIAMKASAEDSRWQTPPRGSADWVEGYQGYSHVVGYAQVKYTSTARTAATVTVVPSVNPKYNIKKITYEYNGVASDSEVYQVSKETLPTEDLKIKVIVHMDNEETEYINLEPLDFVWSIPAANLPSNYQKGQKGGIVEMFGWPFEDIGKECEFMGKAGWLGVKVYPPQDGVLSFDQPQDNLLNPWYWVYQPVAYKLTSRMGTRAQYREMVKKCRAANVLVYNDMVLNHMSGGGNDVLNHCNGGTFWGPKQSFSNSPYYTLGFTYGTDKYTGKINTAEYPGSAYGPLHFHCERSLNSWSDGFIMNAGYLSGLTDLATENDYVRDRIATWIVENLGAGASGIRMDAAKHICPDDIAAIFGKVKTYMGGALPDDFMAYLEVITGGEGYLLVTDYNNYQYTQYLTEQLQKNGLSESDIMKVKIWQSWYPKEWGMGEGTIAWERLVIENDDHDQQKPGSSSRDMQDFGSVLVKEKDINKHRNFEVQLFSRTDRNWTHRLLLSSYTLQDGLNGNDGFPDGLSDCSLCTGSYCGSCKSIPKRDAYVADATGYTVEGWRGSDYTRTHRDTAIINAMRGWMGLGSISAKELGIKDE
ncbi:alpha-amylase, putative [Entamoeba invadens IP1]|uniref:Alpha-amylase n=1 Tax=Entamoeba invadens IP1 TaxID=370355 RepID=A0A0A1U2P3_ENTIV|nr:alpha-amylase, putative [Entamoeba invadens IP1]XP_004185160.1 alpha-amylase, putative [Entamoeba invadens IP1]ELP85774.1 alpha-amylase, putative [Entamoeba invadens IP1]ELP85814.1 alpha-amylase, putative [Entamoeba invadens IP1]|eukprot:XP_004185120.1 alpha-amylase, putative [Entamoeba invadens IP1]